MQNRKYIIYFFLVFVSLIGTYFHELLTGLLVHLFEGDLSPKESKTFIYFWFLQFVWPAMCAGSSLALFGVRKYIAPLISFCIALAGVEFFYISGMIWLIVEL